MKIQIKTFFHSAEVVARLTPLAMLTAAMVLGAAGSPASESQDPHAGHDQQVPATLVTVVRNTTGQYIDVNHATAANYQPLFGCVTGPDHGAMGIHYINLDLYGDGEIDETRPEALIYEPWEGGLRLVGVEFIVDAATWNGSHDNTPPMLEG